MFLIKIFLSIPSFLNKLLMVRIKHLPLTIWKNMLLLLIHLFLHNFYFHFRNLRKTSVSFFPKVENLLRNGVGLSFSWVIQIQKSGHQPLLIQRIDLNDVLTLDEKESFYGCTFQMLVSSAKLDETILDEGDDRLAQLYVDGGLLMNSIPIFVIQSEFFSF